MRCLNPDLDVRSSGITLSEEGATRRPTHRPYPLLAAVLWHAHGRRPGTRRVAPAVPFPHESCLVASCAFPHKFVTVEASCSTGGRK